MLCPSRGLMVAPAPPYGAPRLPIHNNDRKEDRKKERKKERKKAPKRETKKKERRKASNNEALPYVLVLRLQDSSLT